MIQQPDIVVEISKKVFNPVYLPYLEDITETQIFYGGSSSGKSYYLAERVVYDLLAGKRNYLICRKVGKYVMKSVWIEVENVISSWGVDELFEKNKSDRTITCIENKKQAIFTGLDEPQKLKSIRAKNGAITDIWIEEATETEQNDLKELEKRQRGGDSTPKRVILSFNPILQNHWIYETFFSAVGWTDDQTTHRTDKLSILKTTYKNNRFLTQQDIIRLESETDKYYHDVYTLGNWGVLGNVIFTNWKVQDLSDMHNQFTERRNGLDFGFSKDPAAIGCSHYDKKHKIIYFFDEFYETGFTNDLLADECKRMFGGELVTCDSSEPKSIKDLQNKGVNAVGAVKGKDSVRYGIDWLQQQTIIVDKKCVNLQNELRQYKWREGMDGKPIMVNGKPVPIDAKNHLIDGGLRYAYEGDMTNIHPRFDSTLGKSENYVSRWK